jgi:hypothetical protein
MAMDVKYNIPRKTTNKTSDLRSHSVIATKTLHDMERSLDQKRFEKAHRNDQSFSQIEKENYKLKRVFALPPIKKMS